MRISEFIKANRGRLLEEWDHFALSLCRRDLLPVSELRDHAAALLAGIAQNIEERQSEGDRKDKSWGRAPRRGGESAAEQHATSRELQGFDISEMVSEYRALRAAVVRLWTTEVDSAEGGVLDDLTRFNEAIDQAVAESVERFRADIDRSRELFLGVLGHDLRNPLGTIVGATSYLRKAEPLSEAQAKAVAIMERGAARLELLVGDLMDVARTRLGHSLPVTKARMDLGPLCELIVLEAGALHPDGTVTLDLEGDLAGWWDGGRLAQMLSNIAGNAVQHGKAAGVVTVSAIGNPDFVVIRVHNEGDPISDEARQAIFEPLKRRKPDEAGTATTSMGLGMYIANEVARAHGGSIVVDSSTANGTTFTIELPRTLMQHMRDARDV